MATYLGEGNSEVKPVEGRQDINSEAVTSTKRAGFGEMTKGVAPLPLPAGWTGRRKPRLALIGWQLQVQCLWMLANLPC